MTTEAPYFRDTTAISEITRKPVHTWPEEWQHECEDRAVLAMPKVDRGAFNRAKDTGEPIARTASERPESRHRRMGTVPEAHQFPGPR